MRKQILHTLIAFTLTLTLLSPPVLGLFDIANETVALIDFNEEDNQQKGEKEVKEKNALFYLDALVDNSIQIFNSNLLIVYQDGHSNFVAKIQLPPPRHT